MMPIVDATVLLKFHETGKASEWNLLLLWSMFFVAANVSCFVSMFICFIYTVTGLQLILIRSLSILEYGLLKATRPAKR